MRLLCYPKRGDVFMMCLFYCEVWPQPLSSSPTRVQRIVARSPVIFNQKENASFFSRFKYSALHLHHHSSSAYARIFFLWLSLCHLSPKGTLKGHQWRLPLGHHFKSGHIFSISVLTAIQSKHCMATPSAMRWSWP